MRTKIICRAAGCIFNEARLCTLDEIIYDPAEGCLSYEVEEEIVALAEEAEAWEDEDLEWEDEEFMLEDEEEDWDWQDEDLAEDEAEEGWNEDTPDW
ncbi:MAG: hypothetical protein BroJett011_15360 [Chloroflexota bacterium]|nr:MAG: hypothetical protein BroJett011_15360 [Chloroflexota bacterium]